MGNTSIKPYEEPTHLPTLHYFDTNSETTQTVTNSLPSFKSRSSSSKPKWFPTASASFTQSAAVSSRKRGLLSNVNNGVTNVYISSRICKIAAAFWSKHVETLSHYYQLEVGCSICSAMISTHKDVVKHIMKSSANIEKMSLKFLEMTGWFIRHLSTDTGPDSKDLLHVLTKLGAIHDAIGINITHFDVMLQAIHETFSHYFSTAYSPEIRYAMHEIFALAAKIMTGQHLKCELDINQIMNESKDTPFLQNLDLCLQSSFGRKCLFKYLAVSWCDEMVLFLRCLSRFKNAITDEERLMIAKEIVQTSVNQTATFALNLSYDRRVNVTRRIKALERLFDRNQLFVVPPDFFIEVEEEVLTLISNNHWKNFVDEMKILQAEACHV